MQATILTALLQPQPEAYDLFDDVLLIAEGSIIYHGPREDIVPFFESCGFKCPERKGVPDFLQEVTSKKDQVNTCTSFLSTSAVIAFGALQPYSRPRFWEADRATKRNSQDVRHAMS